MDAIAATVASAPASCCAASPNIVTVLVITGSHRHL